MKGPAAFEEGLAKLMEARALDTLVKTHFPEEYKFFVETRDRCLAHLAPNHPHVPPESFTLHSEDGKYRWSAAYPESVQLVQFIGERLVEHGYDFYKLVEEARVQNKTLQLARAIEATFGKGAYKEIMSTDEDSALKMLEQLKESSGAQQLS